MTLNDIALAEATIKFGRQLTDLKRFYGNLPMPPADPFALFVWEVASLRTSPRARTATMAAMRRIRALTPDAVRRAPRAQLEAALANAGSSVELRVNALLGGAEAFRRQPRVVSALRRPLIRARRALRALPQLDVAAAHRMLLFAADHAVLPVDPHVLRVAGRLGYGGGEGRPSARAVRREMATILRRDLAAHRRAFVYLSHHGAVTCLERDPHCGVCPLRAGCPYGASRMPHRSDR